VRPAARPYAARRYPSYRRQPLVPAAAAATASPRSPATIVIVRTTTATGGALPPHSERVLTISILVSRVPVDAVVEI